MSSQREERLAKAWRKPLIVGLGTGPRTPSHLSDSIEELREWGIELTKEEEKEARDIALQKRDKRKEFLASFRKVLEKVRKNDRSDKMGLKEMIEKGEMILPKNISEKQKKLLLEVFTDVVICREKGKPLQVVAPGYEGTFGINDPTLDMIDSMVEIYPSEDDRIISVQADNFSFPGEGVKCLQGSNPEVIIRKAGKPGIVSEEGLKLLTVHLNPKQTGVEESVGQKVEERKKEAVSKEILEKAEAIAQELGTSRVKKERKKLLPDLYEFLRFEDRNLKIRSRWPYFAVADPKGAYFYIYARQKGKAFKRLVFFCSWRRSKIEVYKPGPWEEVLNSLYQKALACKRKKEKTKKEMREQELVENFNL